MMNKEAIEILKQTGGVINPLIHPVEKYTASQVYEALNLAIKALEERPQSVWKGNNYDEHICLRCGHYALYEEDQENDYYEVQSNFCPNCGAKMEGSEEE